MNMQPVDSGLFEGKAGLALALALLAVAPLFALNLDPGDYDPVIGFSSEAQSSRNTSAIARLFGEIRTSMSDLLFIKTERYVHGGVAYSKSVDEEGHSHEPNETRIRQPEDDWRGFVGILERKVKPWQSVEHHMEHSANLEILPWFRLMTILNPHRIRGYRIGAFTLLTSGLPDARKQARDYIEEGIRNNPKNHEMQYMMVRIILDEQREFQNKNPKATEDEKNAYLSKALEYARRGIDFGVASRPQGGWKGKGRPAEMEDSFAACMHYEIMILRRQGKNQEALDKTVDYLRRFGSDVVLEKDQSELRELLGAVQPSQP